MCTAGNRPLPYTIFREGFQILYESVCCFCPGEKSYHVVASVYRLFPLVADVNISTEPEEGIMISRAFLVVHNKALDLPRQRCKIRAAKKVTKKYQTCFPLHPEIFVIFLTKHSQSGFKSL